MSSTLAYSGGFIRPLMMGWIPLPWGTPQEVAERIIAAADRAGANMVQISLNRGAMPQEMFMEQIRRFAKEVLPALQAHEVSCVPATEAASA